jgi:hypothetical protein
MAFTDLVQWAAMCGYEYKQIIKTEHETWVVVIVDRDGSEITCEADTQEDAVMGMIHRLSALMEGGAHNGGKEGTCEDCGN